MNARPLLFVGALALASASGCATGATAVRASSVDSLHRLGASALAREAQRDAPEAYAEFARAVSEAEASSGDARAAKEREAELVLAWAATQARASRARARTTQADERIEAARAEQARIETRVTELEAESDTRAQALAAMQRASALPDGPSGTESVAREQRQQARLALAATAMMGVAEPRRAAVQALIDEADRATGGAQWAASGRALREAEALVRDARLGREPAASVVIEATGGGEDPVEPRRDARGVVLTLRALFDGRGALAATANGRLAVVVQALRSHPTMRARVEVYVGGADATRAQRSAGDRAQAVKQALVSRGIEAQRVESEGLARVAGGARSEDVVEVVLLSGS
jgi:outer membrane protein OmpA-like peptidoglycan-associated protein